MSIYPPADAFSTHHWWIDGDDRVHTGSVARQGAGVIARGTVTPVAASGWIESDGFHAPSLEAGVHKAGELTRVLELLRGRFPGYRWFVRSAERAAA
jgi:hypothetical protein